MRKPGKLEQRRSPSRQAARAERQGARLVALAEGRSPISSPVSLAVDPALAKRPIDPKVLSAARAPIEAQLARRYRGSQLVERLARVTESLMAQQRAAAKPRCASCGARVGRSGGLLVCRRCGKAAA